MILEFKKVKEVIKWLLKMDKIENKFKIIMKELYLFQYLQQIKNMLKKKDLSKMEKQRFPDLSISKNMKIKKRFYNGNSKENRNLKE